MDRHIFKTPQEKKENDDNLYWTEYCEVCGENFRDTIHLRVNEI